MANICEYKIKAIGKKTHCEKLVDMLPAYNDKYVSFTDGTDEDYTIIIRGDCKWSVDSYTTKHPDLKPFTEEEVNAICDGNYRDLPLQEKSLALGLEIYCDSMDIDDRSRAPKMHFKNGKKMSTNPFPDDTVYVFNSDDDEDDDDDDCYGCTVRYITGETILYHKNDKTIGCHSVVNDPTYGIGAVSLIFYDLSNENLCPPVVGKLEASDMDKVEDFWNSLKNAEKRAALAALEYTGKTDKKKYLDIVFRLWIDCNFNKKMSWKKFFTKIKNMDAKSTF